MPENYTLYISNPRKEYTEEVNNSSFFGSEIYILKTQCCMFICSELIGKSTSPTKLKICIQG